ncbi:MAG TPA: alpha-N-acetylglucosaminidase C-terminal domain-containing protein, partial [Fimbriimonas sp.]|nr:alpha-N-acetylglucosaminidase C-terminal domain-containing protein [Fimbriimonas sp.]
WIYGTLHNYGHTTNLAGDLQGFADRAATALSDPGHGRMLGMGITPEGIDQNPVVYELMTDAMWTTGRIDVPKWLEGYVESRYGQAPAEALRAWRLLLASVYGEPQPPQFEDSWRFRPGDQPPVPAVDKDKVAEAARLLASAADRLSNRDAYRRDLVDVVKTWLGGIADDRLEAPGEFFEVLDDLDRLMTTRPEHRLSTWLNDARSWGETGEERALLEKNARWLITSWGGPYLYDYAIKEWAGLNGDFIRKRWQLHFEGKGGDYLLWETDWANSVAAPKERAPDDPIQVAFELVAKFREAARESPYAHSHRPGRDVAKRTHGAQCLSIGKPVRCSSGGNAAFVTDGSVTKGFWNADPAPQWIEVDLEEEQEVSGLWLFPCFGDGRSYKYFVEVAGQSKIYHRVVDQSQNRTPSTLRGHRHKILSQMARYVRLTMVENSVGLGVQLYELFVYGWQ